MSINLTISQNGISTNSDTALVQWYGECYRVFITSNTIADKVRDSLQEENLVLERQDIKDSISLRQKGSTNMIELIVTTENPNHSFRIADALADVVGQPEMKQNFPNIQVNVIDRPEYPTLRNPSDNKLLYPLLGMLLGLGLGALVIWLSMLFPVPYRARRIFTPVFPPSSLLPSLMRSASGATAGRETARC